MSIGSNIRRALRRTSSQIALWAAMATAVPVAAQTTDWSQDAFIPDYITPFFQPAPPEDGCTKHVQHADEDVEAKSYAIEDTDDLIVAFSKTQLGRDLLAWSKKNKVSIVYNADLEHCGTYDASKRTVTIQEGLTLHDRIITLAHEIWHARQHLYIGYTKAHNILVTPQQRWTIMRFVETDAFAFGAYFLADYAKNTGETTFNAPNSNNEITVAEMLRHEMTTDGLTLREYREYAFERFLPTLSLYEKYTSNHLERNDTIADEIQKQLQENVYPLIFNEQYSSAKEALKDIKKTYFRTPTDKQFEKLLRKFGAVSLAPDAPTCLQDKHLSKQTLLEDYPFQHVYDKKEDSIVTAPFISVPLLGLTAIKVIPVKQEPDLFIPVLRERFRQSTEKYDKLKNDIRSTEVFLKEDRKNAQRRNKW